MRDCLMRGRPARMEFSTGPVAGLTRMELSEADAMSKGDSTNRPGAAPVTRYFPGLCALKRVAGSTPSAHAIAQMLSIATFRSRLSIEPK